jgi:hypothetical protein
MNELLERLGIAHPIILAPMGGGPGTPELVAAVSNAGGPFAINLFAGGYSFERAGDAAAMLEILSPIHEALGLPPPAVPAPSLDPFPEQLEAVLDDASGGVQFHVWHSRPERHVARMESRSLGQPPQLKKRDC